jgi:hypothetical protein
VIGRRFGIGFHIKTLKHIQNNHKTIYNMSLKEAQNTQIGSKCPYMTDIHDNEVCA